MEHPQSTELRQLAEALKASLKKYDLPDEHKKLCAQIALAMKSCAPNISNVSGQRVILKEYEIEDVLPYIRMFTGVEERGYQVNEDIFFVRMSASRYKVFIENLSCVRCGIIGDHFKLERMTDDVSNRGHFNLYGKKGTSDVLITKDHIKPKSKGGGNTQKNLQTMCTVCNNSKGNSIESGKYFSKITDWKSPNKKWLVTTDIVSGYPDGFKPNKYSGRAIDLSSKKSFDWHKNFSNEIKCDNKLPDYILEVIRKINPRG